MSDCVFCEIAAKEAPGSFVYEDESTFSILTFRPINRGHTLVIPKSHVSSLSDLSKQMGGHLFQVGMDIAKALRNSEMGCDGVNYWLADGEAAGQEVFHVHLHVLPRFKEDNVQLAGDRIDADRTELDATAEVIRTAFKRE